MPEPNIRVGSIVKVRGYDDPRNGPLFYILRVTRKTWHKKQKIIDGQVLGKIWFRGHEIENVEDGAVIWKFAGEIVDVLEY